MRAGTRLLAAAWLTAICVLLASLSDARGATFPGTNGRIVFTSDRDGGYEIYSMAPNGSDVRQLTNNADSVQDIEPSLSPDGRKVAFSSTRDGNFEIYLMDAADGSNQTRVTNSGINDRAPAWYPDGLFLVETRGSNAATEIFRIKVDGTNATQLTDDSGGSDQADDYATVTPDGTKILWEREIGPSGSSNTEIFSMNSLTGGSKTNLTNDPGLDYNRPSVSPDGSRFAWSSTRSGGPEVMTADVATGGSVSVFTDDPDLPAGSGFSPSFSPDGAKLLFGTYYNDGTGGGPSFYSANLNGTGIARLTPAGASISGPFTVGADWSPATTELLTVTRSGTGDGSITATTTAGSTPSFTSASYLTGASVTLSAAAAPGSAFIGWSGDGCTGRSDCSLTMDAAKNVTATFDVPATMRLTGKPRPTTRSKTATFRFSPAGGAAGSTLCQIDTRPARLCISSISYRKLKRGRHVFSVHATLFELEGPTLTYRWRVR